MLYQGIHLLDRFAQDDRVRILQPRKNLQIKFSRPLSGGNDFVAYVDAIGRSTVLLACSSGRRPPAATPKNPPGSSCSIRQLICYSWITGIPDVAQVVFVRRRLVEIQYLRTTITDEQRNEFGQLVDDTVRRIEAAQFLPHSGVRFPQNPCTSCPYVGLCLGKPDLIEASLVRRPGGDLDWIDELNF